MVNKLVLKDMEGPAGILCSNIITLTWLKMCLKCKGKLETEEIAWHFLKDGPKIPMKKQIER